MHKPIYVIGSGPAGVATAQSLLDKGHKVVMLDSGFELEDKKVDVINRMAAQSPQQWNNDDIAAIKGNFQISANGVSEKLVFGSNYSNRQSRFFASKIHNASFYQSFAKGGLSNLWGRGILPIPPKDSESWPFPIENLDKYYKKILSYVPLSGEIDNLETIYPIFKSDPGTFKLSSQNKNLLNHLNKNKQKLEKKGISFGKTRLAADMNNCRYCGLCLYGCPYGLLYSSAYTVEKLKLNDFFSYKKEISVDFVEEKNNIVTIHAWHESSQEKSTFEASRVFIAAGSISSTRIILKSLALYNTSLEMKCSDLYYIPSLTMNGGSKTHKEALFSLSQLMIEIKDTNISPHFISMHLHGYNDLYKLMIENATAPFKAALSPLTNIFLNRLFVVFAFIHSEHSAKMILELDKDDSLLVTGEQNDQSKIIYNKIRKKIWNISPQTKLFPIPFYKKTRLPGQSMHFGGSFPMTNNPSQLQSDILGRVAGMKRVHVTDAAIFPEIPAGSYTLTIMANAARIATEV